MVVKLLNYKNKFMGKSDIQYALELIGDAISSKDWDGIYEVKEYLKEFLDERNNELEE
jgi:hypothetical protein